MNYEFPGYLKSLQNINDIDNLDIESITKLISSAIDKDSHNSGWYCSEGNPLAPSDEGCDTKEGRARLVERLIELSEKKEFVFEKKTEKYKYTITYSFFQLSYILNATEKKCVELIPEDFETQLDELLFVLSHDQRLSNLDNEAVYNHLLEQFKTSALKPENKSLFIRAIGKIADKISREWSQVRIPLTSLSEVLTHWFEKDPDIKFLIHRQRPHDSHQCIETYVGFFEAALIMKLPDDVCLSFISDDPEIQKHQLMATMGSLVGTYSRLSGYRDHKNNLVLQKELIDRVSKHKDAKECFSTILRWYIAWVNDGGQIPLADSEKTVQMLLDAGADVNARWATYETGMIEQGSALGSTSTFFIALRFPDNGEKLWRPMLPYADFSLRDKQLKNKTARRTTRKADKRQKLIRKACLEELLRIAGSSEEAQQKRAADLTDYLLEHGLTMENYKETIQDFSADQRTMLNSVENILTARVSEKIYGQEYEQRERFFRYSLYSLILAPVGIGLIMSAIFAIIFLIKKHISATVKANDMTWEKFTKQKLDPNKNMVVMKEKPNDKSVTELIDKFKSKCVTTVTGKAELKKDVRVLSSSF